MKSSRRSRIQRITCIASLVVLLVACTARAQAPTGILRGQVTDPSGAAVVGATVLVTPASGEAKGATSGKDGTYEIKDLPPGTYKLDTSAPGFALFSKPDVVITAGQVTRLNIQLTIEVQQEKVVVNDTTTQVDVNPANNASTVVIQGKDLEALSDDPDELQSELEALAGPSAGPNGGQMYIDGFTAGQLPPKASIREIRLNQNPFSTEYDKLGYGRIEIFTKPGTDKLHGQLMVNGNSSAFNSRNPFENLPEGTSPPAYHTVQYSGNIGGALGKKASFFFNIEQRDIQNLSIVSATVLDPEFNIVPYSAAIANPQNRTNLSPRLDYQITPNNTLTARYQFFRNSEQNDDVGAFGLAQVAVNDYDDENTVQISDTQVVNSHTINETRFQYVRTLTQTSPVNPSVNVNVQGAFNGNGSGGFKDSDLQNRYELQNITYMNFGKHAWKYGGRLRITDDANSATTNFNGSFTFGARLQPGCMVTAAVSCQITPIQAYQITEQGLASGLTIPEIQALGGGASYYTQTAGIPEQSVNLIDAGLFVQDDWKIRQNLTLSYGLRFETQNDFSDKADFAPRVGVAWGIGGSAKKPPKMILRAGFGMFYDRFTYNMVLQQERLNGINQQSYQVLNPEFYLSDIPPVNQLPSSTTAPTIYSVNNNLHAPYTIQTGITLERQLTKSANIAVTYLNSRGVHVFYTNNLNPADPVTGERPNGINENIFQYQSEGTFKQNQLIVNGSLRMGTRLSLFGYYTLNYANSDVFGTAEFPSNPYDLQQDWGRASFDVRNRVFLGGTIGLPRGFRLSPFMVASSGPPFNITTGADPYQDSVYNTRPAFGTCPPDKLTTFGCFNSVPGVGYVPIPPFYGEGTSRFALNLRFSKTFGFGPVIENASSGMQGGGMGGGTFGRGPGRGGPGGGRGMDAGSTNRKYALTLGVNARNVFNNVNLGTPIGNLSSPQFGEANSLAGGPYNNSTANRRIDLQLTFSF
jgi:Carboxypeptidase regulatory-like domain